MAEQKSNKPEQSVNGVKKFLEEYKNAVDASSIVSKTDPKGIITYANEAFCEISGYSLEELIGSGHNIVRHPESPDAVFKDLWKTIKSKKIWKGEIKNRKKDGGFYYVHATIVPILDENNEIVEFIAIRQDLTDLYLLKENLEERVVELTEKNREKDQEYIQMLRCFLDSSPNLIIVYENGNVSLANKIFFKILGLKEEDVVDNEFNLETLFEQRSGFISSIKELKENYRENKISVKTKEGRRIFYLVKSYIDGVNERSLIMYTLNDITLNEYQKLKIEHYNTRLEDFIKRGVKKSAGSEEKEEIKEFKKEKRELSGEEKEVLKHSRDGKALSAQEYAEEIDDYVREELQELAELEVEIEEALTNYEGDKRIEHLQTIANRYMKFASIINGLFEFKDLAFAINSLTDLLNSIGSEKIDETKERKISMFLANLLLDLSNWRRTVFVDQSARDIHYLDSSLFSTILQLELIINENDKAEDDEDDLELF